VGKKQKKGASYAPGDPKEVLGQSLVAAGRVILKNIQNAAIGCKKDFRVPEDQSPIWGATRLIYVYAA